MQNNVKASKPGKANPLQNALKQSKQAKVLIEESASELSSVNGTMKFGLGEQVSQPIVEVVLEKNEAIENKVQEAAEKLASVNRVLAGEVRARVMLEHQVAALTEQEESARHAAFHDTLTGLPNRALFEDRLKHGLAQAKRHSWGLAVMFLDLDEFKSINDSYGHDAGDSVLRTVSQRLKENTRGDDSISRRGGDEFLYLVMETSDDNDVASIAEKLIGAIQAPCTVIADGTEISLQVKASIGIAVFPKNADTADELITSADLAMYLAKKQKSGFAFAE